jgi:D-alanyl-D-alanine carboxypeptidase
MDGSPEKPQATNRRSPLWVLGLIAVVLLSLLAFRLMASNGPSAARGVPETTARASPGTSAAGTGAPAFTPASPTLNPTADGQASEAPPACGVGDEPAPHAGYGDWARTLLDPNLVLSRAYQPRDLVPVREAGFTQSNLLVRSIVIHDLAALRDAAADSGNPFDIIAAYRSYALQDQLFQRRVREFGLAKAYAHAAAAGHSEHQLGTTIDAQPPDADDVDESFGDTSTGRWLAANAYRFGFVLSYPRGRSEITCYAYEPWHFRYLGRERAEQVHESGLTLREFLWREDHAG